MNSDRITGLLLALEEHDKSAQPHPVEGQSLRRKVSADAFAEECRYWEERTLRTDHPICVQGNVATGTITGGYPSSVDDPPIPICYQLEDGRDVCPACRNGGNGCPILFPEAGDEWQLTQQSLYQYVELHDGATATCCQCGTVIESAGEPIELDDAGRIFDGDDL